jgi:hypothetical protein
MSQQNQDIDKLTPLEAAVVRNLRMIAPKEREELLALSEMYVEYFPVRPALRLVKSSS